MPQKSEFRINAKKFYELVNKGWQIIDVRSKSELTFLRVLPNSVNIPYPQVIEQMSTLFPDKDAKLIMICNAGNRSGISAKAYQNNGYKNVYVLDHGLEDLE